MKLLACLLRGSNTRTNFTTHFPSNSPISMKIRYLLNHKKISKQNSPSNATSKTNIPSTLVSTRSSINSSSENFLFCSGSHSFQPANSNLASLRIGVKQEIYPMFDDVHRPELSGCIGGLELAASSQFYSSSWPFPTGFDQLPLMRERMDLPKKVEAGLELELAKFEGMKMERQMSASLFAMSGVNEGLVNADYDPSATLWDIPTLSQLLS